MNKNKYYILVLISLFSITLNAQLSSSAYSVYPLGEIMPMSMVRNSGAGYTAQAYRGIMSLNPQNPASYSALRYTVYEAAGRTNIGSIQKGNQKAPVLNGSFEYLSIGFPIWNKRKMGASLGLIPFSNSQFGFHDSGVVPVPYKLSHLGKGGINNLYFGIGKSFGQFISLGLQTNYLFGNQTDQISYDMPADSNLSGVFTSKQTYIKGIKNDFGVQFHYDFQDTIQHHKTSTRVNYYNITGGFTWTFPISLKGEESYSIIRETGSYYDTLAFNSKIQGRINLPQGYKMGIAFQKYDHWNFSLEYGANKWSGFNAFNTSQTMADSRWFSGGLYYTPNYRAAEQFSKKENRTVLKYLSTVEYRIGYKKIYTHWLVDGVQINEDIVTTGFGFPVKRASRSEFAKIQVSCEYLKRGKNSGNLVREDFLRILFGITFTDKWFQVRKIY